MLSAQVHEIKTGGCEIEEKDGGSRETYQPADIGVGRGKLYWRRWPKDKSFPAIEKLEQPSGRV